MYYYIADGRIVETGSESTDDAQKEARILAATFDCPVYVIRGEHAGIEVSPGDPTPEEIEQREEDERAYRAELDKLAHWNAMIQ